MLWLQKATFSFLSRFLASRIQLKFEDIIYYRHGHES